MVTDNKDPNGRMPGDGVTFHLVSVAFLWMGQPVGEWHMHHQGIKETLPLLLLIKNYVTTFHYACR